MDKMNGKIAHGNLGKIRTQETKDKMSKAQLGKKHPHTDETKRRISNTERGKIVSDETRRKIGVASAKRKHSEDTRIKMSISAKKRIMPKMSDETKRKIGLRHLKKKLSDETKKQISVAVKKLWTDDEYACKVLKRREKSIPELKMDDLLKRNNLPYEFVGNGVFRVGGKNPDFVNKEKHKIIEVFGNHWHRVEEEKKRIEFFASWGWQCLVIWASELPHKENVLEKIIKFDALIYV